MKILNLYAGIGGNRKLWGTNLEITAVEWDASIAEIYKDLYPNDNVIVGDAHQYLLDHYSEYDFHNWSIDCVLAHFKRTIGFNWIVVCFYHWRTVDA